jgi:molybdopterin-guanine dinucleotide biosynthesis protein A
MPVPLAQRCVVLPCGGKGTRLGLPYPKELHVVLPGKPMIDLTLERIETLKPRPMLVVVLSAEKAELACYLLDRCAAFPLRIVRQNAPELVGALGSALAHLGAVNLILMPDQAIEEDGAIERAFRTLEGGRQTVVLAHKRTDRTTLHDEGALATDAGILTAMAEKPGPDALRYDSAWCGLGFRGDVATAALRSLEHLYAAGRLEGPEWEQSPFRAAPVIFVEDYVDLGIWERLTHYQRARL